MFTPRVAISRRYFTISSRGATRRCHATLPMRRRVDVYRVAFIRDVVAGQQRFALPRHMPIDVTRLVKVFARRAPFPRAARRRAA